MRVSENDRTLDNLCEAIAHFYYYYYYMCVYVFSDKRT